MDSSEPDQNEGKVGRGHYEWIREQFSAPADLKVFAIHHHLLPIPGTGRERSTVTDAGDLLEVLLHAGAHVVLSGHKHVPYVWCLENMYIANAGTVSSLARARLHEALLQRAGVRRGRGQDPPEVPVRRRSRHGALLAVGRAVPSGARAARRGTHRPRRRVTSSATASENLERESIPSHAVIVLVDGEHYPPVTRWGIDIARERGHEVVGALLVGGNEKLDPPVRARPGRADCVAGRRSHGRAGDGDRRVRARGRCWTCPTNRCWATANGWSWRPSPLARGHPVPRLRLPAGPTDRGSAARRADARRHRDREADRQDGDRPARSLAGRPARPGSAMIVAMGRGGPAEPQVAEAGSVDLARLLALVRSGEHAASDYLEDALTTGVTTIGARRAGGGLAGAPFATNVREAAELGGRAGRRAS